MGLGRHGCSLAGAGLPNTGSTQWLAQLLSCRRFCNPIPEGLKACKIQSW